MKHYERNSKQLNFIGESNKCHNSQWTNHSMKKIYLGYKKYTNLKQQVVVF
jgi:hypothetical protein